jgi:hypothetical protein
MQARTQEAAGYYVWEIPDKQVVIHLRLDLVDRLLAAVMRGFGAVPKRGAEVGGVLIGTVEQGERFIVRVEDYEPVECAYTRGPSFLLAENERSALAEVCDRWRAAESHSSYAVGYFRSSMRDGLSLESEDLELLERFFPAVWQVALLIKPSGINVSTAGFFFREDGGFPQSTLLEFPFQRYELTGEEAPPRRPLRERRPRVQDLSPTEEGRDPRDSVSEPAKESVEADVRRRPTGWIWIPLSFVFLIVGLALGYFAALTAGAKPLGGTDDFSLGLSVSRANNNLNVRWDREAPAIRLAQRGVLEIEDGTYTKPVDLDAAQLQNGSFIYGNSSGSVRFRLVVYPKSRVSVAEAVEWKR